MLGAASPKPGPLYLAAKALAAQRGSRELPCSLFPALGSPEAPKSPGAAPGTGQFQRVVLWELLKNGTKTEQESGP